MFYVTRFKTSYSRTEKQDPYELRRVILRYLAMIVSLITCWGPGGGYIAKLPPHIHFICLMEC